MTRPNIYYIRDNEKIPFGLMCNLFEKSDSNVFEYSGSNEIFVGRLYAKFRSITPSRKGEIYYMFLDNLELLVKVNEFVSLYEVSHT